MTMALVAPFTRIKVQTHLLGGTLISWDIDRRFKELTPYSFTVQFGRNVWDDSWTDVNAVPVIDVKGVVVDSTHRLWAKHPNIYYRVKLVTGDANTYFSTAQQAIGNISRRDWLLARKVAQNKNLLYTKYGGVKGYFLKQRTFGTSCPGRTDPVTNEVIPCTDFDTNSVIDSDCPTCFGTGIQCGYYAAIDMFCMLTPKTRNQVQHPNRGTSEDMAIRAETLAWPAAEDSDVWIQADSDARYRVQTVQNTAEIRGLPLVQVMELRKAPVTDPIHSLPISGSPCGDSTAYGYGGYGYI